MAAETHADGRMPVAELLAELEALVDRGWQQEIIGYSQPAGTDRLLPIVALRTAHGGPATWILAGIHGEEPAGPNAIVQSLEQLAALGEHSSVVLLPLLNPHGYARNWRYLNTPVYSDAVEGHSVGDSSHLLPDPQQPGRPRAEASSPEALAITDYILRRARDYPPARSIDLHEDNLLSAGYVYSQGALGAADPLALKAVQVLREAGIAIQMDGLTRFDEPIEAGVVGPVVDSSIDELMGSATVLVNGQSQPGPGAPTVLVFETPAANLPLAQRVAAHAALLRAVENYVTGELDPTR